jgi:hypothetical protein
MDPLPLPTRASPPSRALAHGLVLAAAMVTAVLASVAWGETPQFQVIVNPANPTSSMPRDLLADAFLKKATRWDNGDVIRPVDLRPDSEVRRSFSSAVLQRSVAVVRSYWEQRIFSGRDVPPPELDSDEAIVHFVAQYPGAVGYVSPGAKLDGTKLLTVR